MITDRRNRLEALREQAILSGLDFRYVFGIKWAIDTAGDKDIQAATAGFIEAASQTLRVAAKIIRNCARKDRNTALAAETSWRVASDFLKRIGEVIDIDPKLIVSAEKPIVYSNARQLREKTQSLHAET